MPDMFARSPTRTSLIQLPWKPEVGWLAGDLVMERQTGRPGPARPRSSAMIAAASADKGYRVKTGVECEFFLIDRRTGRSSPTRATPRRSPATTIQAR